MSSLYVGQDIMTIFRRSQCPKNTFLHQTKDVSNVPLVFYVTAIVQRVVFGSCYMSRRDSFLFTTSSCARPLRRLLGLMTQPSEDLRSQITSGKEYSVQASCTNRIVMNGIPVNLIDWDSAS